MAAATFFSCPKIAGNRSFMMSLFNYRRHGQTSIRKAIVNARKGEHYGYGGNLVDENMIVLRMRIKEMKISETGETAPSNWMEWEKKYFVHYNEDVCEAIGLLQTYLMNSRPSLAIGMLALIGLGLPISTSFVLFNVVEMVKRSL